MKTYMICLMLILSYCSASAQYADAGCTEGDCRNGKGVYTWDSGAKYEGQFLNGKRTGQAVYTFPGGDTYAGEFVDGKFQGQGTYAYANGDVYKGQWRDGKMSGHGVLTRADGTKQEGEFQDGAITQTWKMDVEEMHGAESPKKPAVQLEELGDDTPPKNRVTSPSGKK